VGEIPVSICVFEDVGADERVRWKTFFLIVKLRRFGRIIGDKKDTNSILLSYPLNTLGTCEWVYNVLHNNFSSLLHCLVL